MGFGWSGSKQKSVIGTHTHTHTHTQGQTPTYDQKGLTPRPGGTRLSFFLSQWARPTGSAPEPRSKLIPRFLYHISQENDARGECVSHNGFTAFDAVVAVLKFLHSKFTRQFPDLFKTFQSCPHSRHIRF